MSAGPFAQADFSFFFDAGGRRRCYLAPERFFEAGESPGAGDALTPAMDVFALGCVLAELFADGAALFDLSQARSSAFCFLVMLTACWQHCPAAAPRFCSFAGHAALADLGGVRPVRKLADALSDGRSSAHMACRICRGRARVTHF